MRIFSLETINQAAVTMNTSEKREVTKDCNKDELGYSTQSPH
jgi:hypothetical protein